MRSWSVLLLGACLAACSEDSEPAAEPAAAPVAAPADDGSAKAEFKLDPASVIQGADTAALVPSPAEMQLALTKAGLTARLAESVSKSQIGIQGSTKDQVAVRTGVVLADLLLTLKGASKEELVARLDLVGQGVTVLGGGKAVTSTIADMSTRIANDAVTRDDLVREVDELSGIILPALEYTAGSWVVPLIQAGAWVEGAHLVSGALQAESKVEVGEHLLRQPMVVEYFLGYVQREGSSRASDEVVAKLEETLLTLKEITAKDVLGSEDVEGIHSATGAVLGML